MIKFRAWDNVNKCMDDEIFVYGATGSVYESSDTKYDTPHTEIEQTDNFIIMQSTGLKDKNGVDIFEGDLLDFDEKEWGASFGSPETITMDKITGKWDLHGGLDDVSQFRAVVGNIYEGIK